MCRGLTWGPLLPNSYLGLGSFKKTFLRVSCGVWGTEGKRLILCSPLLLSALGRGYRDSGQAEITQARGGGGGYHAVVGWAGNAAERQGYLSGG